MSVLKYMGSPMAVAFVLLALGLLLDWWRRRERPNLFLVLTLVGLAAFVFAPLGPYLAKPLEDQYRRAELPAHIEGIVALSGGLDPLIVESRGAPAQTVTAQRLGAAAELARRFPQARLIFSGGSPEGGSDARVALEAAVAMARELGIREQQLVIENQSTNTHTNLVYSMRIAKPQHGQTWMLVTSATHMPRAMAIARKLGWQMTPWPSEYLTGEQIAWMDMQRGASDSAIMTERAVHEWLGLVVYRLAGWL